MRSSGSRVSDERDFGRLPGWEHEPGSDLLLAKALIRLLTEGRARDELQVEVDDPPEPPWSSAA